MTLKNIPANMNGYKLMITEAPAMKMRENENGVAEPVTDRQGVNQFVVSLFAKRRPGPGEFAEKGEEIKVTLTADPGEGFEEGTYVQLVDATMSHWQNERNGRFSSGISFRANGLTPAA
ncbi:hypothetical protein SAMN05216215_103367 [Saccharopolyspora shandongensis]|uniref:Uncharacterized protein n=1 Tax=Saccharopolyspora shandongensis TaxID=418495 RepID=A0A1H3M6W2_9PSEU|nr:hypothetical protein [Saccharopolyspora shandongensis]SDY71998.1 hypothetical protein SAMN05216215_103367 [Saccharopolyspora shandongensis]